MAEKDFAMQIPTTVQLQPQVMPQYQQAAPLLQALDWLLSNPSIPLNFRNQFYVMWENVTFGNYELWDIKFLMSKFREWSIQLLWFIPEQKWGNLYEFIDDKQTGTPVRMDLNMLLNTLEQLYFIQLTRGKEGFTVKEMTTLRHFTGIDTQQTMQQNKGGIRLF